MNSKYFPLAFLGLSFAIIVAVFFILKSLSPVGLSTESWAVFIILFTLFGIIAISIFLKYVKLRDKQKEGL